MVKTQTQLLTSEVDWLGFDVAFWMASFDADPAEFRSFLKKHDPVSYRIVTTRYSEYLRVRRLLRRETAILLEAKGATRRLPPGGL